LSDAPQFVLASASPRRHRLLTEAGYAFSVLVVADAEPEHVTGELPADYARRAAVGKSLAASRMRLGEVVVGADTVVAVGDLVLGKPQDEADAVRMLGLLSGRAHEVHTGVAAARLSVVGGLTVHSDVATTRVRFRWLSGSEIREYVATGEPLDKAGAYGIQDLGGALVEGIEGPYDNVVGLPLDIVGQLLRRFEQAPLCDVRR
jgi:septum formation protein